MRIRMGTVYLTEEARLALGRELFRPHQKLLDDIEVDVTVWGGERATYDQLRDHLTGIVTKECERLHDEQIRFAHNAAKDKISKQEARIQREKDRLEKLRQRYSAPILDEDIEEDPED